MMQRQMWKYKAKRQTHKHKCVAYSEHTLIIRSADSGENTKKKSHPLLSNHYCHKAIIVSDLIELKVKSQNHRPLSLSLSPLVLITNSLYSS